MRRLFTRPILGRRRSATVSRLGAAAVLVTGCLALGSALLRASDGGQMSPGGGGDAIGSLPFNTQSPPEGLTAPIHPSIVLEAPSISAIKHVVIDAWGDGWVEATPTEGGVRVEFQGDVHVVLDRHRLGQAPVRFALDVSQGFSGGLGILTHQNTVVGSQILPAQGDLQLPLLLLAGTGLLDVGGMTFHSYNVERRHHALEMVGSGGTLRLSTRE